MFFNNPFKLFDLWYKTAQNIYDKNSLIGNAASLNTVDENGKPSARIVLLQNISHQGFVFYTNKESKKGKEMEHNKHVSILFYWQLLSRQIRIEGTVKDVPPNIADLYFQKRPYLSKIGSWASNQSHKIENPGDFEKSVNHFKNLYPQDVPRPPYWSGFQFTPNYFEFWKNAQFRLHTRRVFEQKNGEWVKYFIYP